MLSLAPSAVAGVGKDLDEEVSRQGPRVASGVSVQACICMKWWECKDLDSLGS